MNSSQNPIVLINILTPKPGKLEELVEHQKAAQKKFAGLAPGFQGSRMFRAVDGRNIVNVAVFDSIEAHQQWIRHDVFQEHRETLLTLVEKMDPAYYQIEAETGVGSS